jgi:hypothetical protein
VGAHFDGSARLPAAAGMAEEAENLGHSGHRRRSVGELFR